MIGAPPADARTLLLATQQRDLATVRAQLRDALRDNKALRQRLRVVLNCVDPRCSVCAVCLDAVRDAV